MLSASYLLSIGFCVFFNHVVSGTQKDGQPFAWKNCGDSNDLIKVFSLDVSQNKTDNIYITGNGSVALDINSPIQGKVEMKKRVAGLWIPIPCLQDFGTCSYDDICSLSPYKTDCPNIYQDNNLPCHCPILQGQYSFQSVPMNIKILPRWLESGLYNIRATLKSGGKQIVCLKMTIDIEI